MVLDGIGPDGPGHDRAVDDQQARMAVHAAVRVDHTLALVAAHGAAAERVHSDKAAQVPARAVEELRVEGFGDLTARHTNEPEVLVRAPLPPVEVEIAVAGQAHAPVGDVAAHRKERHRRGRERARAPEGGDLPADVTAPVQPQPELEQAEPEPKPLPDHLELVARLDDPVDDLRVAAVLDVVRPAGAAIGGVRNPDRAGDHGPVSGGSTIRGPPFWVALSAIIRMSPFPEKRVPSRSLRPGNAFRFFSRR